MKILFLSKRYYMSKDLIQDKYGRFYELPQHLHDGKNEVILACLGYPGIKPVEPFPTEGLPLYSQNLGMNPIYGLWRYHACLSELIQTSEIEIIVAGSDCFQVILGYELAKKFSLLFVADLYDNFESYPASRLPGVLPLFYRALANADAITVVSQQLKSFISQKLAGDSSIHVLENAVSDIFLKDHDRSSARRMFGFEEDHIYIGTAGDLKRDRGINELIEAFHELAGDKTNLHLVLAGRKENELAVGNNERIHYLGQLEHKQVPLLFSALDLGVVCMRDTAFGRYCFPQKFYEMVARQLPIVAARLGEMTRLLSATPELLYAPNDCNDLKQAIQHQLQDKKIVSIDVPTWKQQSALLSQYLGDVIQAGVSD